MEREEKPEELGEIGREFKEGKKEGDKEKLGRDRERF